MVQPVEASSTRNSEVEKLQSTPLPPSHYQELQSQLSNKENADVMDLLKPVFKEIIDRKSSTICYTAESIEGFIRVFQGAVKKLEKDGSTFISDIGVLEGMINNLHPLHQGLKEIEDRYIVLGETVDKGVVTSVEREIEQIERKTSQLGFTISSNQRELFDELKEVVRDNAIQYKLTTARKISQKEYLIDEDLKKIDACLKVAFCHARDQNPETYQRTIWESCALYVHARRKIIDQLENGLKTAHYDSTEDSTQEIHGRITAYRHEIATYLSCHQDKILTYENGT